VDSQCSRRRRTRIGPTIKGIGARIGDWLATVGWAKFFFVAVLLLIVGAIADNVFYNSDPVVVVKMGEGKDRVQVNLQVAPDGVRIQAPERKKPPSAKAKGDPSVKIDEKGLRINSGDKGA
jgi:hypothetical protein